MGVVGRFWQHTQRGAPDECWLWTGPKRGNGYGGFYVSNAAFYAHRWSYQYHYGCDPGAMSVLHHCDTPLCVNPAHLFLGNHSINAQDMERKGRGGDRRNFGPRNGRAKLTPTIVATIRRRFAAGESQGSLARE